MPLDPQSISLLFENELARFENPNAAEALRHLAIPPRLEQRPWDYGVPGQTYPCWIVAIDPAAQTSFAYCDQGFGPKCPWGLLAASNSGQPQGMGMDCGWFTTLQETFLNSWAGAEFDTHQGTRDHFLGQRELISLLHAAGHAKTAKKLESLRIATVPFTAPSLLIELAAAVQAFQRKSDDTSKRITHLLKQNLADFHNQRPTIFRKNT